jgi:hypothetical protein
MNDTPASMEAVSGMLRRKPIAGLKEVLVVKDGKVIPLFPFEE